MKGPSSRSSDASKERRAQTAQRVHFEAMVAVGGAEGGAAFEAESVDVSSQGMRLRTAYLPGVGDQLVCRFDGPEGELIAVGEVLWATEQSKGGEFGLKFVDLDPATEEALKALSLSDAIEQAEPEDAAVIKPRVAKNARVKLHIEGLASPMKARVRDGDDKEVCVGSSLEFLKLGRQVEVEDVDVGDRREGFVDAVKVEVDPATSVPQLVVTLRFDAARLGASAPSKAARDDKALDDGIEPAPITRVTGTPASKRGESEAPKPSKSPKKEAKPASIAPDAAMAQDVSDDDDDLMLPPNKLRAAQDRAKDFTTLAASKIGPAFSKVGEGARGFFASIRGTMDKRREARDEAKKANAPRRVTAPPPSGALTSEGRRVVRQDQGKDTDDEPVSITPKRSRKGIVMGAAAGLALVIGIVGVTKAFNGSDEAAPQGAVSSADARKANGQAVPPIPGAPAIAEVPLYGATPLSTTEQVIAQPQPSATAKADSAAADDGDGETGAKSELVREWGHGELKNAKTFKVKMDAAVEGFSANELEDGFSIVVPKRQSMSTSSALVRKDKRLSAVDVENREDGVEIRMKFKGEPPAYRVKVRSDRVEISLGGEGTSGAAKAAPAKKSDPKKVAAKASPKKKKTDKKAPAKKP